MKAVYSSLRSTAWTRMACLALALVFVVSAMAQTQTGQISGTVRDPTGAVIANAKVTIKSTNTGLTREAASNSSGIYLLPSLRPDTYQVTVEAPGFARDLRSERKAKTAK